MKRFKNIIRYYKTQILFFIQKILLHVSFYINNFFSKKTQEEKWVIGVDEQAAYIHNISSMLAGSISISFFKNRFYNYKYDFTIPVVNEKLKKLVRNYYGPILLGKLMNKCIGFIYIWSTGFLINTLDGRKYEFQFIRKHNKKIICCFIGNDIRSPQKMLEFANNHNIDVTASFYHITANNRLKEQYERLKYYTAKSAELYANLIYNAPIDQISYINKEVRPFFYVYPDNKFLRCDSKFKNMLPVKIIHAPSNPVIKGTQIVRASIKKLQTEGYHLDYYEIQNTLNNKVLDIIRESHIVLNEFYSFVPGVLGIEAMASHCALLTSGDCTIETSLPKDSNTAWKVTKYWEIYDNLKFMLDNPSEIKKYADTGFEWTLRNYSYTAIRKKIEEDLNSI